MGRGKRSEIIVSLGLLISLGDRRRQRPEGGGQSDSTLANGGYGVQEYLPLPPLSTLFAAPGVIGCGGRLGLPSKLDVL